MEDLDGRHIPTWPSDGRMPCRSSLLGRQSSLLSVSEFHTSQYKSSILVFLGLLRQVMFGQSGSYNNALHETAT